jgi:hypothetical protein
MPATRWHCTTVTPATLAGTASAAVVSPPRLVTKPCTPARLVCIRSSDEMAFSTSPPASTSLVSADAAADLSGPNPSMARSRTTRTYPEATDGANLAPADMATVRRTPIPPA